MDIKEWLKLIGMEKYEGNFTSNHISYEDLSQLSMGELKEGLGITSLGHRKKIKKAIENLVVFGEDEENIIRTYPYPIAYPYKLMLEEKNPYMRIQILKDVFLNLLEYLGLVAATEYFFSDKKNHKITEFFKKNLYQPQFGHWNHFVRETLAYLENEGHTFNIPEVPDFYKKVETGKKVKKYKVETYYTDHMGNQKTTKKSFTAIGALINFRNHYIGHSVTLKAGESEKIYKIYYPILKDLLMGMDFLPRYSLYQFSDGMRIRLMGTDLRREEIDGKLREETHGVWFETPDGRKLPFVPFYIPPKRYIAGVREEVNLFIYEQFTSKTIGYFSPEQERAETSGEPARLLTSLVERKERKKPKALEELTEEDINNSFKIASKDAINELIYEQKLIEGIYQPRVDNELSIRSFIESQKPLYFLAAEAGAGKTNLLHRVYEQLVEKGKKCLFLKALRLERSTFIIGELKDVLNVKDISELGNTPAFKSEFGDAVFVLLDGCNEHKKSDKLFASCVDLIKQLPEGILKIIVSWRINSHHDYPEIDRDFNDLLFDAGVESRSELDGNPLRAKAAILKPLDKKEVVGLWEKYGKDKRKRFSTKFTFEELELRDREFTQQLSNPLLLRIFLQLNRGKGLKIKRTTLQIWPEWYRNLKTGVEGSATVMEGIIREMYEKFETVLDYDSLYNHPKLKLAIRSLDIDTPFRRLLAEGVLSLYLRGGLLWLTFTMEGAYHYVLSHYLKEVVTYDTGHDLLQILKEKKELKGIKEAAGYCLLDDVVDGNLTRLAEFIEEGKEYLKVVSVPLSKAFMIMDPVKIFDVLLKGKTENVVEAVFLADFILDRNLSHKTRYLLFDELLRRDGLSEKTTSISARIYHRFNLICHEYGKYEESLTCALKHFEIRKKLSHEESLEMSTAYNRLAVAYRKLMREKTTSPDNVKKYRNMSLKYAEKSLAIKEKLLPRGHSDIGRSYDNLEKIHEYREEWKKAIQYGFKLIELYRKEFDPFHPLLAAAYNNTAIVLREDMQKKKSIEFSFKALEIVEKTLGESHIEMAYANWTLCNTYRKFGELSEALKCISKTVSILEKLLEPDHKNMVWSNEIKAELTDKLKKKK